MCESRVILRKGEDEETVMEDVVRIEVDNGKIRMWGLLGEYGEVEGKIVLMDFRGHKIVVEGGE